VPQNSWRATEWRPTLGGYGDNPFTVFSGGQSVKNCVVGITYKWRGLCRSLRLCRWILQV